MMGNRGTRGGDERDAFSRKSRHTMGWPRGALRNLKRAFSKRMRKVAPDVANENGEGPEGRLRKQG